MRILFDQGTPTLACEPRPTDWLAPMWTIYPHVEKIGKNGDNFGDNPEKSG